MEKCKSKYKSVGEWMLADPKCYQAAWRNGYLTRICEECGWENNRKKIGYWTLERCIEEAKKYKKKSEWTKNASSSYNSALKNNWISECTEHMKNIKKPNGYWTLERCIEDAKKYKTKKEWAVKSSSSYVSARKNSWILKCTKHMTKFRKLNGYWTFKRCLEIALTCKTKFGWIEKSNCSYCAAKRHGYFDECTAHMTEGIKSKGHWLIKENLIEDALKYKTKSKWARYSPTAHAYARKTDYYEECCAHMVNNGYTIKCANNKLTFSSDIL